MARIITLMLSPFFHKFGGDGGNLQVVLFFLRMQVEGWGHSEVVRRLEPTCCNWKHLPHAPSHPLARSLGLGNIFAPVCHSVHGGEYLSRYTPPGRYTPHGQVHSPPRRYTPPMVNARTVRILLEYILVVCVHELFDMLLTNCKYLS